MTKTFGRIAPECYGFIDPGLSDPSHEKWKELARNVNEKNKSGKKLLIGRGPHSYTDSSPDFANSSSDTTPANHDCEWIFLDRFGGVFKGGSATADQKVHHLWMDFNNSFALKKLPTAWVQMIAVDYSTWRYLFPMTVKDLWIDNLLQENGQLIFENGISSFKVLSNHVYNQLNPDDGSNAIHDIQGWKFQYENPCHLILSLDQLQDYLGPEHSHLLQNHFRFFNRTIVIPAFVDLKDVDQSSTSLEKKIGIILRQRSIKRLIQVYEALFHPHTLQCWNINEKTFPISTLKPIENWIMVSKN